MSDTTKPGGHPNAPGAFKDEGRHGFVHLAFITGALTESAYVSHHAAFEYYGCANQVPYQVEVSSETPFRTLSFGGITYAYFGSRIPVGIITRPDEVRVTDRERTVLDGINDFEKVMGLEEMLRCLSLIPTLNENALLSYLAMYNKQVLYQKTGYILRHFQDKLYLSEAFSKSAPPISGKAHGIWQPERKVSTTKSGGWWHPKT